MRISLIMLLLFFGLIPTYFALETPVILSKEANLSFDLGSEYTVKDLGTKPFEEGAGILRYFFVNNTKDPEKIATFGIESSYTFWKIDPTEFSSLMEDFFLRTMKLRGVREIGNTSLNDGAGREVIVHTLLDPKKGKYNFAAWSLDRYNYVMVFSNDFNITKSLVEANVLEADTMNSSIDITTHPFRPLVKK